MEQELKPQESLILIQNMINKAQSKVAENGFLYLLWGFTVLFCAIFQFCSYRFNLVEKPEMVWAITWIVVFYQIYYISKKDKKSTVKSYSDELIGYVWMVFGITMFIVGFVVARQQQWSILYALIIGLYGMPTFLSGAIMKFTPLKIGAIFCWVLACAASFAPLIYSLVFLAIAVIVAWIIPGYLLNKKYKTLQNIN